MLICSSPNEEAITKQMHYFTTIIHCNVSIIYQVTIKLDRSVYWEKGIVVCIGSPVILVDKVV